VKQKLDPACVVIWGMFPIACGVFAVGLVTIVRWVLR